MDFELKQLGPGDAERVQRVFERSPGYFFRVDGRVAAPGTGAAELGFLPPNVERERKCSYLIRAGNDDIGFVDFLRDFPVPGTAYVGLFLLDETWQGRAAGREAWRILEDHLRTVVHATRVRVAVVDTNPVGGFWKKMGFTETGEVKPFTGNAIPTVARIWEKRL